MRIEKVTCKTKKMAKSKKKKIHFMEIDQLEIMRGIRKPMPPKTRVIKPKRQKKWNWQDEMEDNENY